MDTQKQHRLDSSTEELTLEQKLLISSSKRQEPQGEEHQLMHTCNKRGPLPLERSTASKSIMTPPSSTSSSSSSIFDEDENPCSSSRTNGPSATTTKNIQGPRKNRNMSLDSTHSAYNTLIIHQNTASLLADTWIPASHEFTSVGMGNNNSRGPATTSSTPTQNHQKSRQSVSPNRGATDNCQNYRTPPPNPYENVSVGNSDNSGNTTSSELSDIPRDYLNQLTVLKHLAKEVQQDPISGTSPGDLLRSASFSKSQPDLSQSNLSIHPPMLYADQCSTTSRPEPQQPRKSKKGGGGGGSRSLIPSIESQSRQQQNTNNTNTNEEILPSVQILEILMRENSNLKAELVNARRKISTIHKLEAELTRLQASHSALFESAERRESLERSARVKLNSELKRLTAVNRELISTTSLQNLSPNSTSSSSPDLDTLRRELSNKDVTISQLMAQNKELSATRERQDVELAAQRATLAEQRTHIEILDTALTSAQANVLRLEEESGKKQEYAEKASNLQRALSSLQVSNEKREQSEKKLRAQLETEITELKLRLASLNANQSSGNNMCWNMSGSRESCNPGGGGGGSGGSSGRSCQSPPPYPGANRNYDNSNEGQLKLLQDKLKASEEHILNLNTQVSKWEHVFAPSQQDNGNGNGGPYRKHSVSTPNTPNSWNSNSRGGTPHFFGQTSDELSLSHTHHRANDLEWKIKDLESRLVEKDALIRILQSVPNSPGGSSPLLFSSSNSSSMPAMGPPMYRDSPGYSMASTVVAGGSFTPSTSTNHLMEQHYGNMANQAAAQLYAKLGQKCESEPPNYANLPLKLRLGGSGSSLVKNSNESLQSGGVSPNVSGSGPGSVSSTGGGGKGKSIDDQLKDLDNQLLSKGGPVGSLKIHSGLCCIPGFSHPGPPARKGKISQPLLESLTNNNNGNSTNAYSVAAAGAGQGNNNNVMVRSSCVRQGGQGQVLPPLPPSTYQTQAHAHAHGSGNARTSSGPPFLSPASAAALSSMTTTMSLSNSVDSILSDNPGGKTPGKQTPGGANVFTPAMAIAMPKGLPPKSPAENSSSGAGKSRSLERSAKNEPCAGKYTVMMYDQTRCRSLDRREAKKDKNIQKEEKKEKGEKLKSSVSSKAAFFQLLSRRSPSPAREKSQATVTRKEEKETSQQQVGQQSKSRQIDKEKEIDADLDAILLDKQGRSSQSQRNRISSKWSSSNTLESVLEQSGSESPWTQRKNGNEDSDRSESRSVQKEKEKENEDSGGKKWGRIVKTPFGLRYTFGSPRVATSTSDNCGK